MIILFLFCAAISAIGISNTNALQDAKLPSPEKPAFESGWSYDTGRRMGDIESFPFLEEGETGHLTISATLPHIDGTRYLSFSNQYSSCQVFVDGKPIFNYGIAPTAPYGRMLGNAICNVPLKSEYSGKTVSIRFEQQYGFAKIKIQEILLGSGNEIRFYYSRENVGVLACVVLMLLMALVMFALYFVQKSKIFQYDYRLFLHLGVFAFIGAVWIWSDSSLPQLIVGNTVFVTVLSFWSFMAMPIPVINVVDTVCAHGRKGLDVAEKAILVNMILQTALYLLNIVDFSELLLVTHGVLIFSLICMLYALLREVRQKDGEYAKGILLALFVLMIFGVAALAYFYLVGIENNNSFYYRCGIVLFVIILIFVNMKRLSAFVEEWRENRVLSKLAFMDIMTHMKNRSAYERFVDENSSIDIKDKKLSLILMDLNDLKVINDRHGHAAGDQALIGAARCIHKVFDGVGESYRIGGDEFVVIAEDSDIDVPAMLQSLNREIEAYGEKTTRRFTIASGFAAATEDDCSSLKELQKKADYRMYINKKKSKKEEMDTE